MRALATLEAALAGRPVERPLRAPLFAALAAEVEGLDERAFLADAGRRARVYADLARSLALDVLVVDSGSGWDREPGGHALIADLLQRVKAVVDVPLGVTLTGPATRGDGAAVLEAARAAAQAGASVVFVREDVAPPDAYARLATPLWGSLKFFRALGVLVVPGDGWDAVVAKRGPFLPCVRGEAAVPHALAVAPGAAAPPGTTAALVTHTEDLAGHVPVRELQAAVSRLVP